MPETRHFRGISESILVWDPERSFERVASQGVVTVDPWVVNFAEAAFPGNSFVSMPARGGTIARKVELTGPYLLVPR